MNIPHFEKLIEGIEKWRAHFGTVCQPPTAIDKVDWLVSNFKGALHELAKARAALDNALKHVALQDGVVAAQAESLAAAERERDGWKDKYLRAHDDVLCLSDDKDELNEALADSESALTTERAAREQAERERDEARGVLSDISAAVFHPVPVAIGYFDYDPVPENVVRYIKEDREHLCSLMKEVGDDREALRALHTQAADRAVGAEADRDWLTTALNETEAARVKVLRDIDRWCQTVCGDDTMQGCMSEEGQPCHLAAYPTED